MRASVVNSFDLVIAGGLVVDGAGNEPARTDVGIMQGRVAAIDSELGGHARERLDATGCRVLPGFIDAHVHQDARLLDDPLPEPLLRQGVTTVVLGQDGTSVSPGTDATLHHMVRYFAAVNGVPAAPPPSGGVRAYLNRLEGRLGVNVAYLAPNGNLRADVVGLAEDALDSEQRRRMRRQLRAAFDEGAIGLSSGLDYIPSRYATEDELTELCNEMRDEGRPYVTHLRYYGARVAEGLAEALRIAATAAVPLHVSHYNAAAGPLLEALDDGMAQQAMTFDMYPYRRTCTILAMFALPQETQAGGVDATLGRLADPSHRRLLREWFGARQPHLARAVLSSVEAAGYSWTVGMNLLDAAEETGLELCEFVCELLLASRLNVSAVLNPRDGAVTSDDFKVLFAHPGHMAGSDGIYTDGRPHPRGWGTFSRYLADYTGDGRLWSWPHAAQHLSATAASAFGLSGRGRIASGAAADIVVLDDEIVDRATYVSPTLMMRGVRHLIVNGRVAVRDAKLTGELAGQVL